MERGFLDIAKALPPGLKAAALALSLALSAALTAAALQAPDLRWLGWLSFLPLFGVVRALRPSKAALAGGFWGACLYACCIVGPPRRRQTPSR